MALPACSICLFSSAVAGEGGRSRSSPLAAMPNPIASNAIGYTGNDRATTPLNPNEKRESGTLPFGRFAGEICPLGAMLHKMSGATLQGTQRHNVIVRGSVRPAAAPRVDARRRLVCAAAAAPSIADGLARVQKLKDALAHVPSLANGRAQPQRFVGVIGDRVSYVLQGALGKPGDVVFTVPEAQCITQVDAENALGDIAAQSSDLV